ncbi:NAC domain-containing protein 78 [Bienertia sinuspersici]
MIKFCPRSRFPVPFPGKPFVGKHLCSTSICFRIAFKGHGYTFGTAVQSSSSSVHVAAGMIRIRDMLVRVRGSQLQWSCDKTGTVNVVLSFDLPQFISQVELLSGLFSSKMSTTASRRGWLCFMFF